MSAADEVVDAVSARHQELIEPDQLLVATPYADRVIALLATWDIAVSSGGREDSDDLGLTRLQLQRATGVAPDTLQDSAIYSGADGGALDITELLRALRKFFGATNEGWSPLMGKNRTLDSLEIGGGSVIFGGDGDPKPLAGSAAHDQTQRWTQQPTMPGTGVRVGMIDTQLFPAPQLAGHYSSKYSDVLHTTPVTFAQGHAAFVAGVILSEAPGASIEVRAVLNEQGRTDSWTAAKAIADLGRRVDVLNLSFSCLTGDGQPPLALATAVNAITPRVVVVAAAGNHGRLGQASAVKIDGKKISDVSKCAAFPAALDNVVAVGATLSNGRRAPYSPTGPWVDVIADGAADSLFLDGWESPKGMQFDGFASWEGTSFAAARVTGLIAAKSNASAKSARATWEELKRASEPPPGSDPGTPPFLPATPWWA